MPDDIHYEINKKLSEKDKRILPEEIAHSTHTKARKIPRKPREPISLISCLGKVIKKMTNMMMVNRRLVNILEERKLIPKQYYGVRRGRSTIDVLNIPKSLLEKKHLAYDTCWRYGIVRWLKDGQVDR
jgi:hypothetical protein